MKIYNFVYLTTNLINNKKYVGEHSTNNLSSKYLGSGYYLTNSILHHGRKNFKRKILEFFNSKREAFEAIRWFQMDIIYVRKVEILL